MIRQPDKHHGIYKVTSEFGLKAGVFTSEFRRKFIDVSNLADKACQKGDATLDVGDIDQLNGRMHVPHRD